MIPFEKVLEEAETDKETAYPFSGNDLSSNEKIDLIAQHFDAILNILGMDLRDASIAKTPRRVAEMYVNELFGGLDPSGFPEITVQENNFGYREVVLETGISIYSTCEHHLIPFMGQCHIAYRPKEKVIGLSKLNRITHYFSRRPQTQERLTQQIKNALTEILTEDVAVVIDALHLCVRMRGIQDQNAATRTVALGGIFQTAPYRNEFFQSLPNSNEAAVSDC